MKTIVRLVENKRRANITCSQCEKTWTGCYYSALKTKDGVCSSCTLINRNKSDSMKKNQSEKVDEEVKSKNKESNGLFILRFTEKRKKCIVKCIHCKTEYERLYKPNIYEQYGCKTCARTLAAENTKKHSVGAKDRLYQIFNTMMNRTGEYGSGDEDYLEKGIRICGEWIENRHKFFDWSLENGYRDDLKIDRIDNDKGYEPGNCRWTTQSVQTRNVRLLRSTNTSGYRGVSYYYGDKTTFRTRIKVLGPDILLYISKDKVECAYHYDKYVRENNLEHTKNFSDKKFEELNKIY